VQTQRWGDQTDEKTFASIPFGGHLKEERRFGDDTIPTQARAASSAGSSRLVTEGRRHRGVRGEAPAAGKNWMKHPVREKAAKSCASFSSLAAGVNAGTTCRGFGHGIRTPASIHGSKGNGRHGFWNNLASSSSLTLNSTTSLLPVTWLFTLRVFTLRVIFRAMGKPSKVL
jgi:hypothetical protein